MLVMEIVASLRPLAALLRRIIPCGQWSPMSKVDVEMKWCVIMDFHDSLLWDKAEYLPYMYVRRGGLRRQGGPPFRIVQSVRYYRIRAGLITRSNKSDARSTSHISQIKIQVAANAAHAHRRLKQLRIAIRLLGQTCIS
jgi:hypothetical protein